MQMMMQPCSRVVIMLA